MVRNETECVVSMRRAHSIDAVTRILAGVDGEDRNMRTMIIILVAVIASVIIFVIAIVVVIVCRRRRQYCSSYYYHAFHTSTY